MSTLTDVKMTIVIYMGMTAVFRARSLLAAGRSPQTRGVFARATRKTRRPRSALDELPISSKDRGVPISIIGDASRIQRPRHQNSPNSLAISGRCE